MSFFPWFCLYFPLTFLTLQEYYKNEDITKTVRCDKLNVYLVSSLFYQVITLLFLTNRNACAMSLEMLHHQRNLELFF